MIVLLDARFRSRVPAFARSMARCSGSVSAQRERASTGAKDGATCSQTHRGERTRERANARTKTRKPQGNARDSIVPGGHGAGLPQQDRQQYSQHQDKQPQGGRRRSDGPAAACFAGSEARVEQEPLSVSVLQKQEHEGRSRTVEQMTNQPG